MGTRYIKQVPNTYPGAGGKQPSNIALAGNLRELFFELTGTVAVAGATNNSQGSVAYGDAWGAIQRIDIVANSSDVLASFSGEELWQYNRKWFNQIPQINPALGDSTSASIAIDEVLIYPFWSPLSVKPLDTALSTTNLTNLRIEVTWNGPTAITSGNGSNYSVSPVLTATGYYDDSAFAPPLLKKIVKTTATPTAAQTDYRIDLPVTPQYRSLMINTAVAGVDDPACISNVQLVSGSTIFADLSVQVLRQGFNMRNGILNDQLTIPAVYAANPTTGINWTFQEQLQRSNSVNQRAWYHLELCPDGYLTEAVNTAGLPEFYLRINVLKACTISVSSTQLFPLAVPTTAAAT